MKKTRYYLDTSALFKRYFKEENWEQAHALMAQTDEIMISEVGIPEVFSIFRRLVREKRFTEHQYALAKQAISEDLGSLSVPPLDSAIVRRAIECLEGATLQGCDSIHVATALVHGCDLFISADQQQCAAAKKMGLNVKIL